MRGCVSGCNLEDFINFQIGKIVKTEGCLHTSWPVFLSWRSRMRPTSSAAAGPATFRTMVMTCPAWLMRPGRDSTRSVTAPSSCDSRLRARARQHVKHDRCRETCCMCPSGSYCAHVVHIRGGCKASAPAPATAGCAQAPASAKSDRVGNNTGFGRKHWQSRVLFSLRVSLQTASAHRSR